MKLGAEEGDCGGEDEEAATASAVASEVVEVSTAAGSSSNAAWVAAEALINGASPTQSLLLCTSLNPEIEAAADPCLLGSAGFVESVSG